MRALRQALAEEAGASQLEYAVMAVILLIAIAATVTVLVRTGR